MIERATAPLRKAPCGSRKTVIASTYPMTSAPTRLPFRLPRPPRTTTASTVTSGASHMKGSTTNTGATDTPATAARATEIAIVAIATLRTSMPIRFATSRSLAVARMASPSRVRCRTNQTVASEAPAMSRMSSRW